MTEKQARDAYDDSKRKRDKAQQNADYYKRLQIQAKDDVSDCKKDVKNLDKRLEDLNKIIRFFENALADQCRSADKKAIKADEAFNSAVFITGSSASNACLSVAFGSDTVFGNYDTDNAYNVCVKERDRVSAVIAGLEETIKTLNSRVNTLTDDMRYYNNLVSRYSGDMRYYKRFF